MGSRTALTSVAVLAAALLAASAPAAQASFGIERFQVLPCKENAPIGEPKECSSAQTSEIYTQAGGHPEFEVADITLSGAGERNGVRSIRIDLPPGLSTNPEALPRCTAAAFAANAGTPEASHCASATQAGIQETEVSPKTKLVGSVYNLEPRAGAPLEFGVDTITGGVHEHSLIVGGVSWHLEPQAEESGVPSGDYHEYLTTSFSRNASEGEPALVRSRLILKGRAGAGLVRNPTDCSSPLRTSVSVEPYDGAAAHAAFTSAVEDCAAVPVQALFALIPSTAQFDTPDAVTAQLSVHQAESASAIEASDLRNFTVVLPEGLTINPAALGGLAACSPSQIGIGSALPVSCPQESAIGTAELDVPGLPAGSLHGNLYLGDPSAPEPIGGPPYTVYLALASPRYGQQLRLPGTMLANPVTGQLTVTFANGPQMPFSELKLTLGSGGAAILANPLDCRPASSALALTPYSNGSAPDEFTVPFNAQGACSTSAALAPTQSTRMTPELAGANSTFSFELVRPDQQQYIAAASAKLPPGLLPDIAQVPLCAEPAAGEGACTEASQIGVVGVEAGAGGSPLALTGRVYLTGPYAGAPYGLSIVVPAKAGPLSLGNALTRATVGFDPRTAQMVINDPAVPTTIGGIPLRIRRITVTINRPGLLRNPTSCGYLAGETAVLSTSGSGALATSGVVSQGCSNLAFRPAFRASTGGAPTNAGGASLVASIAQGGGQANIASLSLALPRQLPSRGTTLQKPCPQESFEADPRRCPESSSVGSATLASPILPGPLTGAAYMVSRAGSPYPDLDLVLGANRGIPIVLTGRADIKKGITSWSFQEIPDIPISSLQLSLPMGSHSALAAYGNPCVQTLLMPTTITAQNGRIFRQTTRVAPVGCGVQIVGHRVIGSTDYITVKTFRPGRVTVGGRGLVTASRVLETSNAAGVRVSLSPSARRRRRPFRLTVHVTFTPRRGGSRSTATVVDTFR